MEYIIITNNRTVFNFYKETDKVIFFENSSIIDILNLAKDKVYSGHLLLTDPIVSTVEATENPFKSIAVSKNFFRNNTKSKDLMEQSLFLLQQLDISDISSFPEERLEEFRYIDLNLITEGIKNIAQ